VERTASTIVPVAGATERASDRALPPLALLASSRRGVAVDVDHLGEVVRFLRETVRPPRAPRTTHPMRSAWWLAPFAACVTVEWWLRRRRGDR
jgi:hypothetical protein